MINGNGIRAVGVLGSIPQNPFLAQYPLLMVADEMLIKLYLNTLKLSSIEKQIDIPSCSSIIRLEKHFLFN